MKKEYSFFRFAWKYFKFDIYKMLFCQFLSCVFILHSLNAFLIVTIFIGIAWIGLYSQVNEFRSILLDMDKTIEEKSILLRELKEKVANHRVRN